MYPLNTSLCTFTTMQTQHANGLHHGYMQANLQTRSFRSRKVDLHIYSNE